MTKLRPDEIAAMSQIERAQSSDRLLKKGAKTALGLATGGAGAALSSRLLPLMSEYIPHDLALKGISKISPSIGNFLKNGVNNGLNLKDGFDFVRDNIMTSEKEPPKENRNIIEKYSPELNQFLTSEIQKGENPILAGAKAYKDKRFQKIIKQIQDDHKANWTSIVETVFGEGGAIPQNQQTAQSQQMQTQQAQQQGGGIDPQLAQLLQQGNALLQKIKGV